MRIYNHQFQILPELSDLCIQIFLGLGMNSYHSRLLGFFSQFPLNLIWRGIHWVRFVSYEPHSQVIKLSEESVLRVIKS